MNKVDPDFNICRCTTASYDRAKWKTLNQISPISYQSLNGANSASRSAIKEVKKGKSSKFNHRDDEQVKSSLNLKVLSHEGSILHPKMGK